MNYKIESQKRSRNSSNFNTKTSYSVENQKLDGVLIKNQKETLKQVSNRKFRKAAHSARKRYIQLDQGMNDGITLSDRQSLNKSMSSIREKPTKNEKN